ncbi:hypothetical protein MRX96_006190 [Rhipicephalus microplus]
MLVRTCLRRRLLARWRVSAKDVLDEERFRTHGIRLIGPSDSGTAAALRDSSVGVAIGGSQLANHRVEPHLFFFLSKPPQNSFVRVDILENFLFHVSSSYE